jgi:hypothetical protein
MLAIIVNGWEILGRVSLGSYHEMWGSWLRHCAAIWKVAASIPDGVTEIFYALTPSGRTIALRSAQLTEMSTRNISWEVKAAGAFG